MTIIHCCSPALSKCYAPEWSYGEICVGCNCCGRIDPNKKAVKKARIRFLKSIIKETREFNLYSDDPRVRKIQEVNVAENLKYDKARLAKLLRSGQR